MMQRILSALTALSGAVFLWASPIHAEDTQGTLLLLHTDDFEAKQSTRQWVLKEDSGKSTFMYLPQGETHQPGRRVKVKGFRNGDKFASLQTTEIGTLELPSTIGNKQALFILGRFTDSPAWIVKQTDIQSSAATITSFLKTGSFGQLNLQITVTPWLNMASSTGGCDMNTIQQQEEAAATAAGYILTDYQYLVYVFPPAPCGWNGAAYIGMSGAWINGQWAPPTYEHELGHNLGLFHAGSAACLGGSTCTVQEYGDPYDSMSSASGPYDITQRVILSWTTNYATYVGNTALTYILSAVDVAPFGANIAGIKVPTPNANRTYWLEYRRSGGVQVRVSAPFERAAGVDDTEILLRAGGATDAIPVGGTYTDLTYGLAFSVQAADGSNATVTVGPAGTPPPPPNPCTVCPCPAC